MPKNEKLRKMMSAPRPDPKSLREEALRETRRGLILDAAFGVFSEKGMEGTTMRAIAAAAGCTTGAVYPHFKSKEEVYGALLARSLDALAKQVGDAVATSPEGWPAFEAGILALAEFYRKRPEEMALGFYLFGSGIGRHGLTKEMDRDLNQRLGRTLDRLEAVLKDLAPERAERVHGDIMSVFAGLVGGLMLLHTGRLGTFRQSFEAIAMRQLEAIRMLYDRTGV